MAGKAAKPSFFDNYTDLGGGGMYLKSDEKQFLIENGVAFDIVGITHDPDNSYGPRYVAFCKIPDPGTGEPEEKKIGFPTGSGVDSRDSMLKAMADYLGDGGEPVSVKLTKPGRAILIESA